MIHKFMAIYLESYIVGRRSSKMKILVEQQKVSWMVRLVFCDGRTRMLSNIGLHVCIRVDETIGFWYSEKIA